MNQSTYYRVTNLSLRLGNTFLKSLLVFIIAKILPIDQLGIFGSVLAIFTLSVYLLGWEIWYIYNRELSKYYRNDPKRTLITLRDQFFSYLILYGLVLPLLGFYLSHTYPDLWIPILLIVVALHASQEIARIYTHIDMHLMASASTLMVQSGWIVVLLLFYLFSNDPIDLPTLLWIHAVVSGFFAFLAFFLFVRTLLHERNAAGGTIGKPALKPVLHNLLRTTKFLVSVSFFLLGIVGGRFVLEKTGNLEANGLYSYFQNIASVSMILLNFGLTVMAIPALIRNKDTLSEHLALSRDFFKRTLLYSILIALFITAAAYLFLRFILHDPVFLDRFSVFVWINLGYLVLNLNSYYNSMLYVWHKDEEVVRANILSFLASVPLCILFWFSGFAPLTAVTAVFVLWSLINLAYKRKYERKIWNDLDR